MNRPGPMRICRACSEHFTEEKAACPRCGLTYLEEGQASEVIRSYDLGEGFKMTPGWLLAFLAFGAGLLFVTLYWFLH